MNKIVKAEIVPFYVLDHWAVVLEIAFSEENGGGSVRIQKVKNGSLRNAALFLGEWVQTTPWLDMKRPEWLEDNE